MPIRIRRYPIVNKAQCAKCSDIIESKHGHDFVTCKCGEIFIDGGVGRGACPRGGANDLNNIIDLSEYVEEKVESEW